MNKLLTDQHIALIGLSGTGKSSVGHVLAQTLGRPFIDTDTLVEHAAGQQVAEIFAQQGEAAFRELEAQALHAALTGPPAVIATGGGIVLRDSNRQQLRHCWVVWLTAPDEHILQRLRGDATERPLLQGEAAARLEEQRRTRTPLYQGLATLTLDTSAGDAVAIATQVLHRWQAEPLWVTAPGGTYPIVVEAGALSALPLYLDALGLRGRCWLISDSSVARLHGPQAEATLRAAGCSVQSFAVPAGEASKSLSVANTLYDWLLAGGVERSDTVLALGGGVVGDLAGFVASTALRGVALVHLPTTALAMIDSSIGGKTGVNHALGKNLIGTFYQPRLVLSDTQLLATLPRREYAAGLAEAIKHGVIADEALFTALELEAAQLLDGRAEHAAALIRQAAAVKVAVVSADEREAGLRLLLNYGHTLGHALEAALGYGTLLHGEAVAIGMELAGQIALRLGRWSAPEHTRQRALLRALDLPTEVPPGLTADALLAPVGLDKKRHAGKLRWVLPERLGAASTTTDVPPELVREVVEAAVG